MNIAISTPEFKKLLLKGLQLVALLFSISQAQADRFCFAMAANYYEQLYCEIQSLKPGAIAVPFNDFRKNDEFTQALLLKRPGAAVRVEVAMPQKNSNPQFEPKAAPDESPFVTDTALQKPATTSPGDTRNIIVNSPGRDQCAYVVGGTIEGMLECPNGKYVFAKNRLNRELSEGALSAANQLNLPGFKGSIDNPDQVSAYVYDSYQRYLTKMIDIGLAEKTMSLGKFAYFFQDITRKGVAFNQRFEVMFSYLKKDKQSLHVKPSSTPPESVNTQSCTPVSGDIYACDTGRKNLVFVRESA